MLKMFLFVDVDECTARYHSEGSVMVFAYSEEQARKIANEHIAKNPDFYGNAANGIREDEKPKLVINITDESHFGKVFVFPDAGCC